MPFLAFSACFSLVFERGGCMEGLFRAALINTEGRRGGQLIRLHSLKGPLQHTSVRL